MPAILPTIIQGPAVLIHNGASFYSEAGFDDSYEPETWKVRTDAAGEIDERFASDRRKFSWTPDGQMKDLTKYFPHAVTDIGKSMFGKAAPDDSVVIHTIDGRKITYPRGVVTKSPILRLGPKSTLFGQMEITCIGKAATQRTAADYWKTVTALAFADATFDETKISSAIYSAAFGLAPYDAMGALDGFEVEIQYEIDTMKAIDVGIANLVLKGMTGMARFKPDNLTEAQIDTLLGRQGVGALQPGESLAKSNTNLVIASDVFSATLFKAGPKSIKGKYATGVHLHDTLEFTSKRTWTAGAANPLFVFTVL